jgi:hypothetical protein
MTRTLIASMLTLHGLSLEPGTPLAPAPGWEPVDTGGENGTGSWSALTQGELVQSGDFRVQLKVSGDGVRFDASWRF